MPRESTTSTTAHDPRVGTVIRGKWHIDRVLGTGGMATVYEATHRGNGRRVALKLLHAEFARDAGVQERFLREGYVGNKIPHRGRVEVLDNDVTDEGAPFLIMELLEGETIADVQKRLGKKMPVLKALDLAEQILDVLAACHAVGIVHRDLKPANVFITREGVVKVLDFGVAQLREGQDSGHTRAGMALGTPSFMAPEQARGLGDKLDGRADLFSVGAMLHFMLSGVRLHKGRSNDEALVMAATQPAPSVARSAPELPVEVIALVDKALAWDRRNRYADAAEMRAAVLALLAPLRPQTGAPSSSAASAASAAQAASAARAAPLSQAPAAEPVGEDHPDIQRLRGLFRQLERLLSSVRQYGWEHPETRRKLRAAFEELVRALDEAPRSVGWSVRPYSFVHRGLDVWEPGAPLDGVPWALFEAGVREMSVEPGVSEQELRGLLSVLLLDPSKDLAPEDDLATVLWEQDLPHLRVACADDWAEGGAAQREAFYEASERLEQLADRAAQAARAEARAMAVAVDREAQGESFAGALGLDKTTRLALSSQFALSNEAWTERYVDALADALVETARGQDAEALLGSLGASSADLVVSGKAEVAARLFDALREVLRARNAQGGGLLRRVASAMFGGEVLTLLLRSASEPGPKPGLARAVDVGLTLADASWAKAALGALGGTDEPVREALLRYVARVAASAAEVVAEHARSAEPAEAERLLQILAQTPGEGCQQALDGLVASAPPRLRLSAAVQRGLGGEALARAVAPLLDDGDEGVRMGALAAVAERRLMEVGPALARRADDALFHGLGEGERRALLDALWALNPGRAEAIAVGLLNQRQVLKAEGREQSRLIATQSLGAHGASASALEALAGAQRGFWGVSDELKAAARAAAQEVQARMNARKEGPR